MVMLIFGLYARKPDNCGTLDRPIIGNRLLWRLCRVLRALTAIWAQFCNPLVEGARRQAVAFAIFCTTQAAGLPGLDLLSPDLSGVRWHDRSDDADVVFIVDPLAG